MGGRSLTISVVIHALLLIAGLFWVLQNIPQKQKAPVDFLPTGGGGGSPASSEVKNRKRNMSLQSNAPRMAAVGAESKFALPEPDASSEMSSLGALGGGGLSAGLGGNGSGGGKGDGAGKGFGNGMGPGLGGGTGGMNPFGSPDPHANAFLGSYYDFKFDNTHKQIKDRWEIPDLCKVYRRFFDSGWNEKVLANYYRAPKTLSTTRITIPVVPAEKAPVYFGEQETSYPAWCVLYKGSVSPPDSGTYRFVCAADDAIAVRFNRKQVMSQHYCLGRGYVNAPITELYNKRMLPPEFIPHPAGYPSSTGYLACGDWFTVSSGRWYDCRILIMETGYGGVNSAVLLLQKKGEEDKPLSLFHVDPSAAPTVTKEMGDLVNIPPYDPASPQWQVRRADGIDL